MTGLIYGLLADVAEVPPLPKELPEEAFRVFVRAFLPSAEGVAEVDLTAELLLYPPPISSFMPIPS